MISKDDIKYNIKINGLNAKISISCDGNVSFVYACYLSCKNSYVQNKLIPATKPQVVERRIYQTSNEFQFRCEKGGEYYFVVFVKDPKTGDVVWKNTESFKIQCHEIISFAEEDIDRIFIENGLIVNPYRRGTAIIKNTGKIAFLDITHIAREMLKEEDDENKVINEIVYIIDRFSEALPAVILLKKYYENLDFDNIISCVEKRCAYFDNSYFIETSQIFKWHQNITIYENYEKFKNVILTDVIRIIERTCKKVLEETIVKMEIKGNNLLANIVNKELHDVKGVQYFFYVIKDGKTYYKSLGWDHNNTLKYKLYESGIYCVQGYVRLNGDSYYTKSHTAQFFTEEDKNSFNQFLQDEKYSHDYGKLDFFRVGRPFEDFVFVQSKTELGKKHKPEVEDIYPYNLGKNGLYYNYLYSSVEPYEKGNEKWIFSGMVYSKDGLLLGNEYLENGEVSHEKKKGMYCVASIGGDGKIRISNDFFNFNRTFYYNGVDFVVCSNRYHLLLLMIKKLGIKCGLDCDKALLTLSSANIQFLTQNTLSRMDVEGVVQCPNSPIPLISNWTTMGLA